MRPYDSLWLSKVPTFLYVNLNVRVSKEIWTNLWLTRHLRELEAQQKVHSDAEMAQAGRSYKERGKAHQKAEKAQEANGGE